MNILLEKNKPLLIYGNPGCGKTYIALELLKDTILLRLDSLNLKNIKNINDYIIDKIKRKNITLMFKNSTNCRGLLIDDLHIFFKHDKNSFRDILNFFKNNQYYDNKIITTCDLSFLKNKYLKKCKLKSYHLKYEYNQYYKICFNIAKDKKFNNNLDELDKRIYESKYNFHKFINDNNINTISIRDNFDGFEECIKKLYNIKYNMKDIFRICHGDEKNIYLNMIENIIKDKNNNNIYKIYNFVDQFNKKDIFYKDYYLLNIPIYMMNKKVIINNNNNNIVYYNKYIVHDMISKKQKYDYNNYLFYIINNYVKYNKYYDILKKYDKHVIDYHKNIYEIINNIKVQFQ